MPRFGGEHPTGREADPATPDGALPSRVLRPGTSYAACKSLVRGGERMRCFHYWTWINERVPESIHFKEEASLQ